jgi:DNA ligase-associated metallophosphoesterase
LTIPAHSGEGGNATGKAVALAGAELHLDCGGALYWPAHGLLAAADLHLEKGSSFAARGILLPPYDTASTLARLARLIAYYAPACVVCLGDNFHDGGGPARLGVGDRECLNGLQRGRDWIWITGNHDPEPANGVGGIYEAELAVGPITFRHLPRGANGEVAGHLHPVARVAHRGRAVSRRCFAADKTRMVMPAFGAYTGGLHVRDEAYLAVFGTASFTAHLLGDGRLHSFAAKRCLRD